VRLCSNSKERIYKFQTRLQPVWAW